MKVTLVSMPWDAHSSPSPALGVLSAYIRTHEPRVEVKSRSEFLRVWSMIPELYMAVVSLDTRGELLYSSHLFPEMAAEAKKIFLQQAEFVYQQMSSWGRDIPRTINDITVDKLLSVTGNHLDDCSHHLAKNSDIVGLSASHDQFFASICLAKKVKEKNPSVITVLGGAGAHVAGETLVEVFPFIDFVIRGEGERRLLILLKALLDDDRSLIKPQTGIIASYPRLHNHKIAQKHAKEFNIQDLSNLPIADYNEYCNLADNLGVTWSIPIEGSRGCWWNSQIVTSNPLKACSFCGVNSWSTRREKPDGLIAEEMETLANQHQNLLFEFTDSTIGIDNGTKLANELRGKNKQFRFAIESRSSIRSIDLLNLKEAGCSSVQVGIEGLSSKYLRRINKGANTIQNMRILRLLFELGLRSIGNLITGFPGATKDEVDETVRNILDHAIVFDPLNISPYSLDFDSAVFEKPGLFNVTNIRNRSFFSEALPTEVSSKLRLPWFDFDCTSLTVNWEPVVEACKKWRELHSTIRIGTVGGSRAKLLYYLDAGNFLSIYDRRKIGSHSTYTLGELERDVYIFCTEIRNFTEISSFFDRRSKEKDSIEKILTSFTEAKLMFRENDEYLSLAVAQRPQLAFERIRAQAEGVDCPKPI